MDIGEGVSGGITHGAFTQKVVVTEVPQFFLLQLGY